MQVLQVEVVYFLLLAVLGNYVAEAPDKILQSLSQLDMPILIGECGIRDRV